jgi:hypothetical protein
LKATLSIIDELGNRYYGTAELSLAADSAGTDGGSPRPTVDPVLNIDFALPIRAFVRRYASGDSGGAAKFTMLLAFIARGSDATDVPGERVRSEWGKLTAHLGAFNRAHATRAKDNAWVDSPAHGAYRLGPLWRGAFTRE